MSFQAELDKRTPCHLCRKPESPFLNETPFERDSDEEWESHDETTRAGNRLFKVAASVGLLAHGLSKSFFDIADPMSRLLIQIEMGTYNKNANAVRAFYDKINSPALEGDMRTIITHWTAITGRDVKARKVAGN